MDRSGRRARTPLRRSAPWWQEPPRRRGADCQQHARHEGGAVPAVVSNRQCLARARQDDLLVGDQAWQAHRVDADATGPVRTACTFCHHRGRGIVALTKARLVTSSGDPAGGRQRGPARRIDLPVVMELDHLDAVEVASGGLCEPDRQHRTEGEVRGHQHAALTRLARRLERRQISV